MLVLSRKKGESIMIDDHIELIILETEGDTVKVGIKAPKQVQVYRKEIYLSIQESNKEASESVFDPKSLGRMLQNRLKNKDL